MWSRIRHRRLQALSLLALAALLTTSLCLGPLYQRAMEQALAGSALANASPAQRALRLSSDTLTAQQLVADLPATLDQYVEAPVTSASVPASVPLPDGQSSVATRLFAAADACRRLEVTEGDCPTRAGQVMVSADDAATNGWTVGSQVEVTERVDQLFDGDEPPHGPVTIVGVYRPDPDDEWLGAPITGRAGQAIQDVGVATDDWVTAPETILGAAVTQWYRTSSSVAWPVGDVDHDELLRIGPVIDAYRADELSGSGSSQVRVETALPTLARDVAEGSDQGRTTVVVLVVQLLVLVAVVLWMVLVAATDDRRPELALARLRGRGRRGAAGYLLAELVPVTLLGVAVGVLVAPFVMSAVASVVFPVPVPRELPGGYVLAALGSAVFVLLVVLAAARRAVREPVDSLLRAVPARHTGTGTGVAEVAMVVFSLTAVVALITGNLEGPLATLAPTLLAVAVGLLLGRALGPATRFASTRLMRSGRAVAAAGIVNAVRRPSARRILVMVVVASALLVFCVDALASGRHNRANAAEQALGAPYVVSVQAATLLDVVDAVAEADPDGEHLSTVVSTPTGTSRSGGGATVAVDPTAFQRVAYFPLSRPSRDDWDAIRAPQVEPVRITGATLAGTMDATEIRFRGPSKRFEDVRSVLQVQDAAGLTHLVPLAVIPRLDRGVAFSVSVPCEEGCVVTGLTVSTPPGLELAGSVFFRDLTLDGAPTSLGGPRDYRKIVDDDGTLVPAEDAAGNVGVTMTTAGGATPVMYATWVPEPVPALVTTEEDVTFTAPGLEDQVNMRVAGTVDRVPGSPPGSRLVDVTGLLRRPDSGITSDIVTVWSDDAGAVSDVRKTLREHGVVVNDVTTIDQVRDDLDASPAAWSLALSVLVGVAAILVAMLVIVVATATTWRARATDLAALRMAGLSDRSLRRLELLGQLPVVLVGAVAGVACGVLAAVLALPGVRQFTDPPDVDTTDFATPWPSVLVAAAVALLLLTALAVATSWWTARRAPLNRIRDVA